MLIHAVFDHHVAEIASLEQFHVNVWVKLSETSDLSVFSSDQLWAQRCELNVEIFIHQIEVGRKCFNHMAIVVPRQRKCAWFVLPIDPVVVENVSKLLLYGMSEVVF